MELGSSEKIQWKCKDIGEDSEDLKRISVDKT